MPVDLANTSTRTFSVSLVTVLVIRSMQAFWPLMLYDLARKGKEGFGHASNPLLRD